MPNILLCMVRSPTAHDIGKHTHVTQIVSATFCESTKLVFVNTCIIATSKKFDIIREAFALFDGSCSWACDMSPIE